MSSNEQDGGQQTASKAGQENGKDGKPTIEKSWKEIMKRVDGIDSATEKVWRDEIDTLLVFAGLFSAVVTAFTIESYQWLSEDPADTTVAVLNQISRQLHGQNATSLQEAPTFFPSPSAVRINTFWFLSLILGLVDALFAIMIKQWLGEYRRPINARYSEQWLALRCLRSESFELWHVPSFLAALPIILEVALFLFFAGVLELLWARHHVPFAFAMAIIGPAAAFYIATAFLPGIDTIRLAFAIHPDGNKYGLTGVKDRMFHLPHIHNLCPYKSPQAWAIFRLLASFLTSSYSIPRKIIIYLLRKKFYSQSAYGIAEHSMTSFIGRIRDPQSWFSVELEVVQRFNNIHHCPDIYVLRAYRWLVREFQDSPSMLPYLQRVLELSHPRLVMPAVFDYGLFRTERDWNAEDVEKELKREFMWQEKQPFEFSELNIRLLFYHSLWIEFPPSISYLPPPMTWDEAPLLSPKQCQAPLTRIFRLVEELDKDLGIAYLNYIQQNDAELYATATDLESIVFCLQAHLPKFATLELDSLGDKGQSLLNFLSWISKRLVDSSTLMCLANLSQVYGFIDTLDDFRVSQNLPMNYFARDHRYFPVSMDRLGVLLRDPSSADVALKSIDVCKHIWDTHPHDAFDLLSSLWKYIFASIPRDLWPPHLQEKLPPWTVGQYGRDPAGSTDTVPYFLVSQEGRLFLDYVNLGASTALLNHRYKAFVMENWQYAMECVAHVNNLPPEYLASPLPNDRQVSGLEVSVGDTTPSGDVRSQSETAGTQPYAQ
ncbi:hypothetical protein V5O48_010651 [Marasmius crinis-equi]|uniref:DUF6535 domain-containing protein n=1 Tax=Marasmius crinis-equi TaxID=585013 RepID=A0ABR3F7U5_9AGAR